MPWNYKHYGSASQPIHKSDLNELSGHYACPRRFRYARDEQPRDEHRALTVNAKTALGTATHEVIARVLGNAETCGRLLRGDGVESKHIARALEQELNYAAEGREVLTSGADSLDKLINERVSMLLGLFGSLPRYVARVVAVEAGFTVELNGIHFAGHIDLLYEPTDAPGTLALADWKTGATKPHPIELSHGWESGIYSLALARGRFMQRAIASAAISGGYEARCNAHSVVRASRWQAERDAFEAALVSLAHGNDEPGAFELGEFPSAIYHVHLGDFVPYVKAGARRVTRPDELAHYGLVEPGNISYVAGDARGPGWLRVQRHERDIPRLAHRIRTVVGTVRMGRFLDVVNEQCTRCPYAKQCLNEGYGPTGDELDELEQTLRAAGL